MNTPGHRIRIRISFHHDHNGTRRASFFDADHCSRVISISRAVKLIEAGQADGDLDTLARLDAR